jgi:predicted protein tyrosine phosphatase
MPKLYVCSLAHVPTVVASTQATHLITLLTDRTELHRPPSIAAEQHLHLTLSDIVDPMDGHVLPDHHHVEPLIAFLETWGRLDPRGAMVIHCWAGVSRSTAAAYIAACLLSPHKTEREHAQALREASSTASPNRRIIALADALLQRDGRMVDAIESIGRGVIAYEAAPFEVQL